MSKKNKKFNPRKIKFSFEQAPLLNGIFQRINFLLKEYSLGFSKEDSYYKIEDNQWVLKFDLVKIKQKEDLSKLDIVEVGQRSSTTPNIETQFGNTSDFDNVKAFLFQDNERLKNENDRLKIRIEDLSMEHSNLSLEISILTEELQRHKNNIINDDLL